MLDQFVAQFQDGVWLGGEAEELHDAQAAFAGFEDEGGARPLLRPGKLEVLEDAAFEFALEVGGGDGLKGEVGSQEGEPAIVEVKGEVGGDLAAVDQEVGAVFYHPIETGPGTE